MGWTSYTNYVKKKESKGIHFRITRFFSNGNKTISLEVSSTPHIGWGVVVDGSEGSVTFSGWFILCFYLTFERCVFPEWVFPKEYNQFADKELDLKSKKGERSEEDYPIQKRNEALKGKARTKSKGWIRTTSRELSLKFHHYHMWWKIWKNPNEWSSDIPKWRYGNIDFVKLLKGKDKVEREIINSHKDVIRMPEGKYMCKVTHEKFTKKYSRWWPTVWRRFEFEFGYFDLSEHKWVDTPVPHWGKGTEAYNCGMSGTSSISLSCEIKTLEEAKKHVKESLLADRKRYGEIDFSKVTGIEGGYVTQNLIGQF